jgi:hypothetical protein
MSTDHRLPSSWNYQQMSDGDLRMFACACCRRIWEKCGVSWAAPTSQEPAKDADGDDEPSLWQDPRPHRAIEAAEAFAQRRLPLEQLKDAHQQAAEFAKSAHYRFDRVNARLGDHYSGSDYDRAFVAYRGAQAVEAASDVDIHKTVDECANGAAWAIASNTLTSNEAVKDAAFDAERKAQFEIFRAMLAPASVELGGSGDASNDGDKHTAPAKRVQSIPGHGQ